MLKILTLLFTWGPWLLFLWGVVSLTFKLGWKCMHIVDALLQVSQEVLAFMIAHLVFVILILCSFYFYTWFTLNAIKSLNSPNEAIDTDLLTAIALFLANTLTSKPKDLTTLLTRLAKAPEEIMKLWEEIKKGKEK